MMANRRCALVASLLAALGTISSCLDISAQSRSELSPSKAVQLVDDDLRSAPLPVSFTPLKAMESRITQGSANVAVEIGFTATQTDLDNFLAAHDADDGPPFFQPAVGCAKPPDIRGSIAPLPDVFVSQWFGPSMFPRCAVLSYAKIPDSAWKSERAGGGIYRQLGPTTADGTVKFVLTYVRA